MNGVETDQEEYKDRNPLTGWPLIKGFCICRVELSRNLSKSEAQTHHTTFHLPVGLMRPRV